MRKLKTHEDGVRVPVSIGHGSSRLTDLTTGSSIDNEEDRSHEAEDNDSTGEDRSSRETSGQRSDKDSTYTISNLSIIWETFETYRHIA